MEFISVEEYLDGIFICCCITLINGGKQIDDDTKLFDNDF